MSADLQLWRLSVACLVSFFLLGVIVTRFSLSSLDMRFEKLRGGVTGLAIFFTRAGRARPLAACAIVSSLAFALTRHAPWIPLGIIASQFFSQSIIEALKRGFRRARPTQWIHREERGLSYPSGHASTAIVFYGTWLSLAIHSPMNAPLKLICCAALAITIVGIDWSRMALGAHYFSDILGGTLFGGAWMFAMYAVASAHHISLGL